MPARRPPVQGGRRPEWMGRAACRGTNPEKWFPSSAQQALVPGLKAICLSCPVRAECLDSALLNDEDGVWGGLTRIEREELTHRRSLERRRERRHAHA